MSDGADLFSRERDALPDPGHLAAHGLEGRGVHERRPLIRRQVMRGLGVDYVQGYGASQPQKLQRAAIA